MANLLYVPLPATVEEAKTWLLILDGINERAAQDIERGNPITGAHDRSLQRYRAMVNRRIAQLNGLEETGGSD